MKLKFDFSKLDDWLEQTTFKASSSQQTPLLSESALLSRGHREEHVTSIESSISIESSVELPANS